MINYSIIDRQSEICNSLITEVEKLFDEHNIYYGFAEKIKDLSDPECPVIKCVTFGFSSHNRVIIFPHHVLRDLLDIANKYNTFMDMRQNDFNCQKPLYLYLDFYL